MLLTVLEFFQGTGKFLQESWDPIQANVLVVSLVSFFVGFVLLHLHDEVVLSSSISKSLLSFLMITTFILAWGAVAVFLLRIFFPSWLGRPVSVSLSTMIVDLTFFQKTFLILLISLTVLFVIISSTSIAMRVAKAILSRIPSLHKGLIGEKVPSPKSEVDKLKLVRLLIEHARTEQALSVLSELGKELGDQVFMDSVSKVKARYKSYLLEKVSGPPNDSQRVELNNIREAIITLCGQYEEAKEITLALG
ncbi:MAG: hypothetical protein AAF824_04855 [Bacteroidota bacterium]